MTGTAPVVVGVDVGGTSLKAALVERSGALRSPHSQPTAHLRASASVVDAVIGFARSMVRRAQAALGADRVAAVGLAVPGIVDTTAGVGVSSMILGWREVPFVGLLEVATGLPVGFGHDVRLAAAAEHQRGAGRGHEDFLFVTLGTGVGAAFVLDGRIYTGAHGTGGELAHFVVEPSGPRCRCGKHGCLEMVASADAVAVNYGSLRTGAALDASQVVQAAAAGDAAAREVWDRATAGLGIALCAYAQMMEPEVVVLGGGMAAAGEALFTPVRAALHEGVRLPRVPALLPSAFGSLAGVQGAAHAAWQVVGPSRAAAVAGV